MRIVVVVAVAAAVVIATMLVVLKAEFWKSDGVDVGVKRGTPGVVVYVPACLKGPVVQIDLFDVSAGGKTIWSVAPADPRRISRFVLGVSPRGFSAEVSWNGMLANDRRYQVAVTTTEQSAATKFSLLELREDLVFSDGPRYQTPRTFAREAACD